ncbi:MAG: response regulator transcription factor [Campylobacterota bacterium]
MESTVLIVEDEDDILELIEFTLQSDGYDTVGLSDTKLVEKLLQEEDVDIILMDRNLPGIDGADFITNLRAKGLNQPVIYVTAKDSEGDLLEGFEKGGDDYITKPFSLDELKARVKAVLKRSKKELKVIKVKDILYKSSSKEFFIDEQKVKLTHLEHDLLLEFMKNNGSLLSREYLLENVWKDSFDKQLKTVNVAIKRLKEKIDPSNSKNYIRSVRGEGYIFC